MDQHWISTPYCAGSNPVKRTKGRIIRVGLTDAVLKTVRCNCRVSSSLTSSANASVVKWYNTCFVIRNPVFDSLLKHHIWKVKSRGLGNCLLNRLSVKASISSIVLSAKYLTTPNKPRMRDFSCAVSCYCGRRSNCLVTLIGVLLPNLLR